MTRIPAWPPKDPDAENQPYWFDWRQWLEDEDDGDPAAVDPYAIAVDEGGDDLTIDSFDEQETGLVIVRLSGGSLGTTYTVRCRITLANGRTEDMSRRLTIAQK